MDTALVRTSARQFREQHLEMAVKRRQSVVDRVFYGANEFQLGTYPDYPAFAEQTALTHNRGEPYAATRPIAQRIAGQPIHVARVVRSQPDGMGGKSWKTPQSGSRRMSVEEMATMPKWARKKLGLPTHDDKGECVKAIKAMHSDAVRVDILESHPVMELLENPNPRMKLHSLIDVTVTSLQFTGKCFWWLTKSKLRKKFDLWYVPSKRVREKPGNVMLEAGYMIMPDNGQEDPISVPAERGIYFYNPDPEDPMRAYAPMSACLAAVRVDESIATCQQQTFENGLFPSIAFITGDMIDPSGKNQGKIQYERWQLNELNTRLEQLMRGPAKHGKHIVLDRTINDVKFLTNKPHEMDWLNSNQFNRDRIWRVVGTPRVVAGDIQDANRATALVADSAFTGNVVNPRINLLSQICNDHLVPLFDDPENIILWIDEATSVDRDAKLKEIDLMLTNRAFTVNELRAEFGKPPLPAGMGDVLVSTAMQVFEPVMGATETGVEERQELLNENSGGDQGSTVTVADEDVTDEVAAKSFTSQAHKDFATAWLKIHGRNEKLFAAECQKFLSLQAEGIIGKLKLALLSGEKPVASELFDPREWDDALKGMARPNLVRASFVGAVNAQQASEGKSLGDKTGADDILLKLPPAAVRAIQQFIDGSLAHDYWPGINDTTLKELSTAITNGLAAGDSPKELTQRVRKALAGTPMASRARMIARSETTGALNSGAIAVIEDMKQEGTATGSEWLATLDEHTRATHWSANGTQTDAEGNFDVGGHKAKFPGDPDLPPAERINCRCTVLTVLAGNQ